MRRQTVDRRLDGDLCRRQGDPSIGAPTRCQIPAVEQQRWRSAHQEEQRPEERDAQHRVRTFQQLAEIELDSAHYEEQRNQKAVADRFQLSRSTLSFSP